MSEPVQTKSHLCVPHSGDQFGRDSFEAFHPEHPSDQLPALHSDRSQHHLLESVDLRTRRGRNGCRENATGGWELPAGRPQHFVGNGGRGLSRWVQRLPSNRCGAVRGD